MDPQISYWDRVALVKKCGPHRVAWENSRRFARSPLEPSQNDVWVTRAEIPYWSRHYPDLGSASDWLKRNPLAFQPIRRTTLIWVVARHQYGISALVTQTSFCEGSSGDLAKRRLSSYWGVVIQIKIAVQWQFIATLDYSWVSNGSFRGMGRPKIAWDIRIYWSVKARDFVGETSPRPFVTRGLNISSYCFWREKYVV